MTVRPPARPPTDPARRALLAKLHLAAKDLRMDEADYRATIERATGQRSAADLDTAGLEAAFAEFRRLGWAPASASGRGGGGAADHPVARKARSMWISLWLLGAVRSPSEAALEAFARRQLRVDRLQWADQGQGYRLIEALKAMAERAGWPQGGLVDADGPMGAAELLRRLIERLYQLLVEADPEVPALDKLAGFGPRWQRRDLASLRRMARQLADARRARSGRA